MSPATYSFSGLLYNIKMANAFVEDVYLYYPRQDYVVGTKGSYVSKGYYLLSNELSGAGYERWRGEVLEAALEDYPGTILAISHDRYFINRFATRVMVLEQGGVKEYLGNYDDYLEQLNKGADPAADQTTPDAAVADAAAAEQIALAEDKPSSAADEYRRRKEEQAEARRIQKKQERLKLKIAQLEDELETISDQIDACAPEDYQLLMEFVADRERLENEILDLMEEAEQLKALDNSSNNGETAR